MYCRRFITCPLSSTSDFFTLLQTRVICAAEHSDQFTSSLLVRTKSSSSVVKLVETVLEMQLLFCTGSVCHVSDSSVSSGCNLPCCLPFCSGSGEDSLDRLLPPAGAPRRKSATSLSKSEPPLLRTGTRTIYTAGRPPWYDEHGAQSKEAFVIGMTLASDVFCSFDLFLLLSPFHAKLCLWALTLFVPFYHLIAINALVRSHMHTARQH